MYIIGNGFDVAHGFKTKYCDFKSWMIDKYRNIFGLDCRTSEKEIIQQFYEVDPPTIPSVISGNKGEEFVDSKEGSRLLLWLLINNSVIGEDWCNFEEALHDINVYPELFMEV